MKRVGSDETAQVERMKAPTCVTTQGKETENTCESNLKALYIWLVAI